MANQNAAAWVRLQQEGVNVWGRLVDDTIHVCTGSPLDHGHECGPHCSRERLPLEGTPLLVPCEPSKIVCVGRNYRAHARELGNDVPDTPLFFLKPPSALIATGKTIRLPELSQQVEHEGELGVVMARRCGRFQPGSDPRPYILGFTCVNDVTARDLQKRDPQWTRAKGFDTFCPAGPWVFPAHAEGTPGAGFRVETRVNGELRQNGSTDDFIFALPEILAAITEVMTLEAGDLIATGSPAGVGPLQPGDRVSVAISDASGLRARIENPVAARGSAV